MPRTFRHFTPEEDAVIRELFQRETRGVANRIAEKLGRTAQSIKDRARWLGLTGLDTAALRAAHNMRVQLDRQRRPDVYAAYDRRKRMKHIASVKELLWRIDGIQITMQEYLGLLTRQGGQCAICRGTNGKQMLCVDHDHDTGRIRGLLCRRCNTGLGQLHDSVLRLRQLAVYLTSVYSILGIQHA